MKRFVTVVTYANKTKLWRPLVVTLLIYIHILCICYVVNSSPNITYVVTPSLNINTQYIHINKSIFIYIYVIFIHMSSPLRYVIHNNIKLLCKSYKNLYIVVLRDSRQCICKDIFHGNKFLAYLLNECNGKR